MCISSATSGHSSRAPSPLQGVLRIAAEALGLEIADRADELDVWWRRRSERLITMRARADDAGALVFGGTLLRAVGADALPAALTGTIDLAAGVDVRNNPNLVLAIDGGAETTVDLSTLPNPAKVTIADIATALTAAIPGLVAEASGDRLRLATPTTGAASRLGVPDADGDAAPAGARPPLPAGSWARPAPGPAVRARQSRSGRGPRSAALRAHQGRPRTRGGD